MGTIFSISREFFEFWSIIIFFCALFVIGFIQVAEWIRPHIVSFQPDNHGRMVTLVELTPIEILRLISPKRGWKFDTMTRNIIIDDQSCSQEDLNLMVNYFIDITEQVLLLLEKAGSNGLNVKDIVTRSKMDAQKWFFEFDLFFKLSQRARLNLDYNSLSLTVFVKIILCHLHQQKIVIITRRPRDGCNYRLDLNKLIHARQKQHQGSSKSSQSRKIIPRTKEFKKRRE